MKKKRLIEKLNLNKPPIFLIDGSSFIYRAFYAFSDLKTRDGFPTNGLYIVLRTLLKILKEESPEYGCFILDGKGPTFRHEIDPSYKANRLKMPEPLSVQIPPILEGVSLLGIPTKIAEDVEADDYIGSMSETFKSICPVVIVGSDKDLFQLIDENVVIWDISGKEEKIITKDIFITQKKIQPETWPLYQAMVGDSSDNIKGIPGIGQKSALSILKRFKTIDDIFKNIDKLPPSIQKKLKDQRDNLEKCLNLTTLKKDLNIPPILENYKIRPKNKEKLKNFLERYEFRSLIKELDLKDIPRGSKKEVSISKPIKKIEDLFDIAREDTISILISDGRFFIGNTKYSTEIQDVDQIIETIRMAKKVIITSLKELLYKLKTPNIQLDNLFDISLGAYLIDPEMRNYSLDGLIFRFLSRERTQNKNKDIIEAGEYIFELVMENELLSLYEEIERPLVPVLISMEKNGIKIDKNKFQNFLKEVENKLIDLTDRIYKRAGEKFNIRSSKQLSHILFQKMGIKPTKKTPKGSFSTSSEALATLKTNHPIVEDILEYRKLEKIRSTYLVPLLHITDKDNRIHTNFNQLATATGRLSSSNPNLQNIPIRGELGKKMRSCFIPEEGNLIISADYSQVELRVLAHFSKDPYLVEAFSKNLDIHTSTASVLFDKDIEDITPDERRKAKTINFGLIYGMGPQKLSHELNIPLTDAKKFIEKYFSKLTGVKRFFEEVEREAEEKEYITTLAGRKRHLPNINSKNNNLASQAKRMAINTKIQGSAADIIKVAMLRVFEDKSLKDMEVRLLLQVHDELLFECAEDNAKDAAEVIRNIMSCVWSLYVPLVVDIGIGKNWAEAH